jgi:predicted phage terminase large subunit-like protein
LTFDDDQINISEVTNIGTDWDLAYTEKQQNSASAYVTAGLYNNKMVVFDVGFKWLEFPELIKYMKIQTSPHYIEAKASGKSAKQTLTNQGIPAVEVTVDGGDKIARSQMASPYVEAGMVSVHRRCIDKLLHDDSQGLLKFPNAKDDLNDAFVQAINRLLGQPKTFFF